MASLNLFSVLLFVLISISSINVSTAGRHLQQLSGLLSNLPKPSGLLSGSAGLTPVTPPLSDSLSGGSDPLSGTRTGSGTGSGLGSGSGLLTGLPKPSVLGGGSGLLSKLPKPSGLTGGSGLLSKLPKPSGLTGGGSGLLSKLPKPSGLAGSSGGLPGLPGLSGGLTGSGLSGGLSSGLMAPGNMQNFRNMAQQLLKLSSDMRTKPRERLSHMMQIIGKMQKLMGSGGALKVGAKLPGLS